MVYNGNPENPVKLDDLGVPPFKETPKCLMNEMFGKPGGERAPWDPEEPQLAFVIIRSL